MSITRILAIAGLTIGVASCRDDATAPERSGPLALDQSEVSVSSPTVASGDTVTLHLTTRDARGRQLSQGGHTVVFRHSGGSSTGVTSSTMDRGDGTYSATFRGVRAGLATTIEASVNGESVTRPLPTVRVRPGAFSAATSIVTVTPRTIEAGGRATIELLARDAAGNAHDTGGLRVSLTLGGGSAAGSIGPVTDHANGRYSATFTAASVGTPLIVSTTVNGTAVNTPAPTVSVARGLSLERSLIAVSSDTVTVGAALHVTFVARDSADVARTSGGDSVRFLVQREATGGDVTVGDVTDHDDGTYSASIAATRDGVVRIAASVNGRQKNADLPIVTVLPIPVTPQKSEVRVSADSIEAGRTATFAVLLRDLDGNPVSGAAHRIRFTLGGVGSSSGSFGPTTDAGAGRYTALFTAQRAGTAVTVGATISDSTQIQMLDSLGNSLLPTITVVPGPVAADSSLLFAEPATVNMGDSALVRLVTRDGFGNLVDRGGRRVAFTRRGGVGVSVGRIGAVSDRQNGTYTAYYRADSAGSADAVHATIDGIPLTVDASITVGPACTPGPLSLTTSDVTINDTTPAQRPVKSLTLQSGVTTTLTLRVKDAAGCAVTQPRNVAFTVTGGTSTGTLGATVNLHDGRYTATFTGQKTGSAVQIVASVDGQAVTSQQVQVTVVPGDISTRTSLFTAATSSALVGASVVLTLRARDAAGNDITTGGRGVVFVVVGSQVHGTTSATTDHRDGTYSATYVAASVGSDTIVALIEGTKVAQTLTITVEPPP